MGRGSFSLTPPTRSLELVKSYLQDNLIQVFRWWGRRQRSEQEKQQGGGVGGEREKEPLSLSLSFYIFVPLSYLSRTPLSERL